MTVSFYSMENYQHGHCMENILMQYDSQKWKKDMLIIDDYLQIINHVMQGLQAMHEKMHHGSVLVTFHEWIAYWMENDS